MKIIGVADISKMFSTTASITVSNVKFQSWVIGIPIIPMGDLLDHKGVVVGA